MFKHVLLPTDGSDLSGKAAAAAIEFAKTMGAKLTVFTSMNEYPFLTSADAGHQTRKAFEEHAAIEARARLSQVVTAAQAGGVACSTDTATTTTPYKEIIEAANRHGCDVIFMASHGGRGLEGLLVGSADALHDPSASVPVAGAAGRRLQQYEGADHRARRRWLARCRPRHASQRVGSRNCAQHGAGPGRIAAGLGKPCRQ